MITKNGQSITMFQITWNDVRSFLVRLSEIVRHPGKEKHPVFH